MSGTDGMSVVADARSESHFFCFYQNQSGDVCFGCVALTAVAVATSTPVLGCVRRNGRHEAAACD